jgi:hypothetical protein
MQKIMNNKNNDLLLFRLAIHQESEFTIESKNDVRRENAAVDASKDNDVYYSKSNLDYLFQLYVFDEFLLQLDAFEVFF